MYVDTKFNAQTQSLHNIFSRDQLNGVANYPIVGIASDLSSIVIGGATPDVATTETAKIRVGTTTEYKVKELTYTGNSSVVGLYNYSSTFYGIEASEVININISELYKGTNYFRVNYDASKADQTFDASQMIVKYTNSNLYGDLYTGIDIDDTTGGNQISYSISNSTLMAFKNEHPDAIYYTEQNITAVCGSVSIPLKVRFVLPETVTVTSTYTAPTSPGGECTMSNAILWDTGLTGTANYTNDYKLVTYNGTGDEYQNVATVANDRKITGIQEVDTTYISSFTQDTNKKYTGALVWNLQALEEYFENNQGSNILTIKVKITTKSNAVEREQIVSIVVTRHTS